ncbi:hypothetical protein DBR06_SOUSAS10110041, partial [Sousa chinensis]
KLESLSPGQTFIYYVNKKAPEILIQGLRAGVTTIITVEARVIISGITVLFFSRKMRVAKCGKAEKKEVGKMHMELNA